MRITASKILPLADSEAHADRRYERKFLIDDVDRATIEAVVRHHPTLFFEIYHRRWVNNIYLDTPDMDNYEDNVSGFGQHRVKLRIRWYGDLSGYVGAPVLELKIKRSWLNWKMSYPLPPFSVDSGFCTAELQKLIRSAELPHSLKQDVLGFVPTLVNRYSRNYFQSPDRAFRVTIDSQLAFHDVDGSGRIVFRRWWDPCAIVLELKYAEHVDPRAHAITQCFPFRLTRSSKYATGINAIRRDACNDTFLLRCRHADR